MTAISRKAVAAAGFAAFVNIYSVQALLPTLSGYFQCSHASSGLTISATTLAVALFSPLAGFFGGLLERRRQVLFAFWGLSFAGLGVALAQDLGQMIGWRFLQGMFLPLLSSAIMTWIGEEKEPRRMASTMSLYVTWSVIGGVSGRLLAGLWAHYLGWRLALLGLTLCTAGAAWILLRQLPQGEPKPRRCRGGKAIWALLSVPHFRAALAAGTLTLFCLVGIFSYITFYLSGPAFCLSSAAVGSLFLVYLFGIFITPHSGRWASRWGYANLLKFSSLLGLLGVLCTGGPTLAWVLIGLALCSTSAFLSQSAVSSFVAQISRQQRSLAMGLYLSAYYLGGCLGGWLPGLLWQNCGWPGCIALFSLAYTISMTWLARRLH